MDVPGLTFRNPDTVPAPIGPYSHLAIVAPGTTLLVIAGQVGLGPDGVLPPDPESQYENALKNVVAILASVGATPAHLVKVNAYLVRPIELARSRAIRAAVFGDARPASTLVYVPRLVTEQYLVEVEATAVKPLA